jgi:chromosome segregation ATPase
MSDKTAEISAAVKTTGTEVAEALSHAEESLQFARELHETAANHGWHGVAGKIEEAVEHLETVVINLRTAEEAARTTTTALDEITDKMSSAEVAEHLDKAFAHLDDAHTALDGSLHLIAEAIDACAAAGQESLPATLNTLRDEITENLERFGDHRDDVGAERHGAQGFAHQDKSGSGGTAS